MADLSPVQQAFIQTYTPLAQDISRETGLDPSVVLGQLAQETGWGQHIGGNNPFGISPDGVNVQHYPSISEGAQAYVDLINRRYAGAAKAGDPDAQAQALAAGGYNKNPKYGSLVAQNAATVRSAGPQAAMTDADLDKALLGSGAAAPTAPKEAANAAPAQSEMSDADLDKALLGDKPAQVEAAPKAPTLADVISSPEATNADIPQSQTPNPALTRVGQAAANAYEATPSILTPKAQAAVDQSGPLGRWIVNPALKIAGGVVAGANALGTGAAQAVNETANALGVPALGRDVNMLAQVAPFAHIGTGVPAVPSAVPEAPPTPRFVQEYYGEGTPQNPLAGPPPPPKPAFQTPSFVPPGTKAPVLPRILDLIRADSAVAANRPSFIPPEAAQPPNPLSTTGRSVAPPAVSAANPLAKEVAGTGEAPAFVPPQSVGAAASREQTPSSLVDMSPKQVQAYRSTAEGQKLLEPQQPGVADANSYIPGVTPDAAEVEQTVNTARELKSLKMTAPEVSQEAKEIAAANNEARQQYFANTAGSHVQLQNLMDQREAQAIKDLKTAFGNKQPADAQPVVDTIQDILKSPRDSENTAVQQYVRPLLKRLQNDDGSLKSDPEQLYGLREDISRMQSNAAKAQTPTLAHVNGQLKDIKTALDNVIEQGAPGYRQYLDNFATASRPIEAMQALQDFEPKLYDAQNRMTYNKVQTMMRNIVDARQSPGLNPYKSISDDTMQRLWALRDDLRRSASAQELAKAPGSDTAQNALDVAKGIGKTAGNALIHGAIMAKVGPVGNFVYQGVRNALSAGAEKRAAEARTARGMSLLRPDTPLKNPLTGPP